MLAYFGFAEGRVGVETSQGYSASPHESVPVRYQLTPSFKAASAPWGTLLISKGVLHMLWLALSALIFWVALKLIRRANAVQRELKRYQFENRTDGGVVHFESYEASQAFYRRGNRSFMLLCAGAGLMPFALLTLLAGVAALFP